MELSKNSPQDFCTDFLKRELKDFQEKNIWMSYWPVMERMIDRADELAAPYEELTSKYGNLDQQSRSYFWLILEHIWLGIDYAKPEVEEARATLKRMNQLSEEIITLANHLSEALEQQNELYEYSGFQKNDYLSALDSLRAASKDNYLHQSYVSDKLQSLEYQYDLKYWPSLAEMIQAIADFEEEQPEPTHTEYPDSVLKGRASDIKDFVIAFDAKFDEPNGLPNGFRFSNNAMADIINVVLDLPPDKLTTGDVIRMVRHRHCKKAEISS